MKIYFRFPLVLLTLFSFSPAWSDSSNVNDELISILKDACPGTRVEPLYRKINGTIKRLSTSKNWQKSLKASIYTSCFLEYSNWRTMMSFNLGHVGISEGLQPATIVFLTSLLSKNAIGKSSYVGLGVIYEQLKSTGLDHGHIKDIILLGRKARYRIAALEGLGYLYIELRKQGQAHELALSNSIQLGDKFKRTTKTSAIRTRAQEALAEYFLARNKLAPGFTSVYYSNQAEYFKKNTDRPVALASVPVNEEKLKKFVKAWLKAKYHYGGSSKRGIDSISLVLKAMKDQYSEIKLPNSASALFALGQQVALSALKPGDLVFFSTVPGSNDATHAGIYLGDGVFTYVTSESGVTRALLNRGMYKKRYVGARRLLEPTQ